MLEKKRALGDCPPSEWTLSKSFEEIWESIRRLGVPVQVARPQLETPSTWDFVLGKLADYMEALVLHQKAHLSVSVRFGVYPLVGGNDFFPVEGLYLSLETLLEPSLRDFAQDGILRAVFEMDEETNLPQLVCKAPDGKRHWRTVTVTVITEANRDGSADCPFCGTNLLEGSCEHAFWAVEEGGQMDWPGFFVEPLEMLYWANPSILTGILGEFSFQDVVVGQRQRQLNGVDVVWEAVYVFEQPKAVRAFIDSALQALETPQGTQKHKKKRS